MYTYHAAPWSHSYDERDKVLDQLGSPLYFKNVKCQNNSRVNDLFQLLFLSSHSQWVRSLHTLMSSKEALSL